MSAAIDSLFDRYERGGMTRRQLVQALVAFALPAGAAAQAAAPAPIVRGLGVNHVQLGVRDVAQSAAFYKRLFGATRGSPTMNAATGMHLALPDGYISISSTGTAGAISHFAVAVDSVDENSAQRLADTINGEWPEAKAKASYQDNDGVWSVLLYDPDGVRLQISRKDGR
jgi:catechol 2,3-dioxygenase-like lactoylglutathione lyase family enzyme